MFRKSKKRHSSSSSQSSEITTKSKSVDSSHGGLSRSSTVASLHTDSTKSSGQSNNNSVTCAEFRVQYVGAIEKLKVSEGKSLEGPLDLINYIDVAQQDGKLPFVPMEEEFIMGVSKYGIKVSTSDQCDVLHRHALCLIIRMVCYDDGLGAGKSLLALKTTDASNEEYSYGFISATAWNKHKPSVKYYPLPLTLYCHLRNSEFCNQMKVDFIWKKVQMFSK